MASLAMEIHLRQISFVHNENGSLLNALFNVAGLNLPTYLKGPEAIKEAEVSATENKNEEKRD